MTAPALSWLPPAGPGWAQTLRALTHPDGAWDALMALATTRLDGLMTIRLDRVLTRLFPTPPAHLTTVPIRLALLGSSTVEHLAPALRVAALRRGLWLDVRCGDYGQYATAFLDPALVAYAPTVALFALDSPNLLGGLPDAAAAVPAWHTAAETRLRHAWSAAQQAGCHVLQQTLLPSALPTLGQNDHRAPAAPATAIAHWNHRLRIMADEAGADIVAVDTHAAHDGLIAWHDPVWWHRAKQDIHTSAAPMYGDLVARILAARQGRSSKALVLDLDNTLWGGVIGDDGIEGIALGQGSALGEAHLAVQSYARALARRGIILAVCSKNDDATARAPFERHPDMLLRLPDIACFIANWTDKATNLRTIATQLNIGLDSLVFLDDNPAERAIIRRELPMVAVPELPDDPAAYAATLAAAGYFEAVNLTAEDRTRGAQYQANAQRDAARAEAATDMEGYLRSLNMELRWSRFDRLGLTRIVQLVNKTNQFNLTTRRTTEAETLALMHDPTAFGLQLRLLDQFGDNGVIAILSGRLHDGALRIETWLMSCRVLGRGVERASLSLIMDEARRLDATSLRGEYSPTAKNGMVRDHYATLGFVLTAETDGTTQWTMPVTDPISPPPSIRVTEAQ